MTRPRASRPALVASLVFLAAGVGCSLSVDLAGYSDGDAAVDSGDDGALDTSLDGGAEVTLDAADASEASADTSVDEVADGSAEASTDASAEVGEDAPDAADASDGSPDAADTTVADAAPDATETAPDAADASDASDAADTFDGNPCAVAPFIGLSEIMVRPIGGTGDTHEWFEITNYSATCTYDVGGLRVRLLSASGATWIERATYTLPAGTSMPPGKAYVFADVRATFLADAGAYYTAKGLDPALVFDLGKTLGDVLVNGADLQVEVYAAGAAAPTDSVVVKTRSTWPAGQSRSLPAPCDPLTARVSGSPATTSTHWMDTPTAAANQYGTFTLADAGVTTLYGTPGRANDVSTTCP